MKRKFTLQLTRDGEEIRSYTVSNDFSVGRDESCDIHLDDRSVSRRHALIQIQSDSLSIEKCSKFGSLKVNGLDCDRAPLKEGDQIQIGPFQMAVGAISKVETQPSDPPVVNPMVDSVTSLDPPLESAQSSSSVPAEPIAPTQIEPVAQLEEESLAQSVEIVQTQSDPPVEQQMVDLSLEPGPSLELNEDDRTRVGEQSEVTAKLIFKPGEANTQEYVIEKDEVTLGRSQNCDITLNDKKSSRKNSVIKRNGIHYSIIDLDSANGTFVNGARVPTAELQGDDQIQIGDVLFQFKLISAGYQEEEIHFQQIPAEQTQPVESPILMQDFDIPQSDPDAQGLSPQVPNPIPAPPSQPTPGLAVPSSPPSETLASVVGLSSNSNKKRSFSEKFNSLPKFTQILYVAAFALFTWWAMDDSDEQPVKKPQKRPQMVASARPSDSPVDLTFEKLTLEQRKFVEAQHSLAFDYYKNKDFDRALFEIQKIFSLVSDYKNSREIERYAKEGKRKLEALEEEKRKKEEELALKVKINGLVDEARAKMADQEFDEARDLFTEILSLDPDNESVSGWRKEIEAFEEQQKARAQLEQMKKEINAEGLKFFNQGLGEFSQGKFLTATATLKKVLEIGVTDQKLIQRAHAKISEIKAKLISIRDPMIAEGKQLEGTGDLSGAYQLFQKALKFDPGSKEARDGISRVRGVLHERAKILYTEAVISENYSDFESAERLFKSCLEIAPVDDIYHERAKRKLERFVSTRSASSVESAGGDPQSGRMPQSVMGGKQK